MSPTGTLVALVLLMVIGVFAIMKVNMRHERDERDNRPNPWTLDQVNTAIAMAAGAGVIGIALFTLVSLP